MNFSQQINGHVVGIVMKELVRRALSCIQAERIAFEVQTKAGYGGDLDDVLTSADKKAQDIYVKSIRECFPDFGIISEEGFSHPGDNYFTIDPVDGTKAFVRGQSHGIGTMISLVYEGEIAAAFIGDVNTDEIFGYRPGSSHVHRITKLDTAQRLSDSGAGSKVEFDKGYGILRDPIDYGYDDTWTKGVIRSMDNYLVDGGSIGTWLARLWKREVVAAFMPPGYETPWDQTPIVGISQKLGYGFYHRDDANHAWVETTPTIRPVLQKRDRDMIIVHKDDAKYLLDSGA